jgi:hypothetical protein
VYSVGGRYRELYLDAAAPYMIRTPREVRGERQAVGDDTIITPSAHFPTDHFSSAPHSHF